MEKSSLQQQQMEGKRIPSYEAFDEKNRALLDHWASWDSYRLSQLTADAFSIRKRANDNNPWIGTFSGTRSEGYAFAGDITGGMGLELHDFWQSYPSSIEISDAKLRWLLLPHGYGVRMLSRWTCAIMIMLLMT